MSFDRKRFMENLNLARQCWKCKFLHIGRDVNHNHCDHPNGERDWSSKRVNGWYNHFGSIYYKESCVRQE